MLTLGRRRLSRNCRPASKFTVRRTIPPFSHCVQHASRMPTSDGHATDQREAGIKKRAGLQTVR